jgi:hypothetical protein
MGRRFLIVSGDKHLVPSEHSPLAVKLAAVKRHQKPLVASAARKTAVAGQPGRKPVATPRRPATKPNSK